MRTQKTRIRLLSTTMIGGVAALAFAAPAMAQSAQQDAELDEVVITGSRIPVRDNTSSSPISTVTGEVLQEIGTGTVETYLNALPQVQPGLTKTRFLQWGNAWIRLAVTPDASGLADLADITSAQRVVTLPRALADLSTDSVQLASQALLELAQQVAVDVGDNELLDGLMQRLNAVQADELAFNTANPVGWVQLESALRSALSAGISPAELAKWVASQHDAHISACGRNG